jgi:uncharacterized protein
LSLHLELSNDELDDLQVALRHFSGGKALGVFALDGFFSALAIGPRWVLPGEWMPWLWDKDAGTAAPRFESRDDAQPVFSLIMRHYQAVTNRLSDDYAAEFEPLCAPEDDSGTTEWCSGFLLGIRFDRDVWLQLMMDEPLWFAPIVTTVRPEEALQAISQEGLALLRRQLVPSLLAIREHFLPARRRSQQEGPTGSSNSAQLEELDAGLDTSELDELFDRLEAATNGKAMDLVLLEGFFAALVVGPRPVSPSKWLPWVWDFEEGTAEPHFADMAEGRRVLDLLMRFYNSVADELFDDAIDDFQPIFPPRNQDGVMAWCAGFLVAFVFDNEEWKKLAQAEPTWFLPFHLQGEKSLKGEALSEKELELFAAALPHSLRHIRDHFRERALPPAGGSFMRPDFPQPRRTGTKIGRNDLCPCGSGKKYKKCCGVN